MSALRQVVLAVARDEVPQRLRRRQEALAGVLDDEPLAVDRQALDVERDQPSRGPAASGTGDSIYRYRVINRRFRFCYLDAIQTRNTRAAVIPK